MGLLHGVAKSQTRLKRLSKNMSKEGPLVVQWLRLHTNNPAFDPWSGNLIPHVPSKELTTTTKTKHGQIKLNIFFKKNTSKEK